MPRRRFDPLADNRRPHWLAVSDLHPNLIACSAVPAGSDLRAVLSEALAAQAADGWQSESDVGFGFVFVARGTDRRLVNLTPADPAAMGDPGHAFLAGESVINQLVVRAFPDSAGFCALTPRFDLTSSRKFAQSKWSGAVLYG